MSLSRKIAILIVTERTTLHDVIASLTKYKMLSLLPSIKQALVQVSSQAGTRDVIEIESPFPLSDDAIMKVKHIVGNDAVEHEVTINPKLLAGFKARYKGMLYDGSADRIIKQLVGNR
jgi:F0F1-type ATP synthase delta subunit